MSEYNEEIDGTNMICPYCKHEYQPEAESYSEDEEAETCDGCGKKYYARQDFCVDHWSRPDCELNGEKHQWEERNLNNGETRDFCAECGEIRPLTA